VTLSNHVHRQGVGWRWPHIKMGKEPQWQLWSGHEPILVFSGASLYFELCLVKLSLFSGRK
jgi:hypothetical protein